MNAVTASPTKTPVPHPTARFKWLLRREYWENRGGFFWAPLVTGAIILGLYLILAVIGSIAARRNMGSSGFVFDNADSHQIGQALGAFGDKNAGTGKAITVSGATLADGTGLASNYTVGNPTGVRCAHRSTS